MPDALRTREFTMTPKQLAQLSVAIYRPLVMGMCLAVVFVLVLVLSLEGLPPSIYLPAAFVGAVGSYLAYPPLMRSSLSKPRYAINYQSRRIEISGDTLRQTTAGGIESSVPLDSFQSAKILAGFYVLTLGPGQFVGIPLDAFASPEDDQEFRGALRAHVAKVEGI